MQTELFAAPNDNLLPFDGEVNFFPGFFNYEESEKFLRHLKAEVIWKQEPIILFGKKIMQPRLTAYCGDKNHPYGYSGITMVTQPWYPFLQQVRERVEQAAAMVFNGVLLNYYRDGQDSMGWHRDNEKELGINPVIASISFGAERKFQFRNYKDKNEVRNITLTNGSLLLMKGATNHFWEHQLPKSKKITTERINLTFRKVASLQ